jgi:hypothetical protein
MTGDVEMVKKKLTAKRTLDLYHLTFEIILSRAPVADNSDFPIAYKRDELFTLIFSIAGGAFGEKLSSDEIKKEAQAKAESQITFINDRMARIEWSDRSFSLATYEDGLWKIDDTEIVKQEILKLDLLTSEE